MAFPVVRQHDAAKIGVVVERNTEKIEDFALVPVGRAPDGCYGIDSGRGAADANLEAQAFVAGKRVQVINDFEARINGITIYRSDRAEADEAEVLFELGANFDDFRGLDFERQLAAVVFARDNGVGYQSGGRKFCYGFR